MAKREIRAGGRRHVDPRVHDVTARCDCGVVQTVPVDSTVDIVEQLAGESCLFCGVLGHLEIVRRAS